jgi:hypothetical protein
MCEDADHAPTPAGTACTWCKVPIADGDQGVIVPCVLAEGQVDMLPWHRECWLRSIVGSPAHLRGHCDQRCHGDGTEAGHQPTTPQEMRAEALETWRMVEAIGTAQRCGAETRLPFGHGTAVCTQPPHPDDPWHRDGPLMFRTLEPGEPTGEDLAAALGVHEMTEEDAEAFAAVYRDAARQFAAEMGGEPS